MKNLLTIIIAFALFSCKNEEKKNGFVQDKEAVYTSEGDSPSANLSPEAQLGQEIFEGKGNCYSCHKPDQKVVGPGMQEIARIYKAKKGNMVSFLKGNQDPLVDPSQFETMKTNLILTKTFTDEELKAIEAYINSSIGKQ